MNDWELLEAMYEAEKRFEALKAEFRARGLHNKPLYEYSRAAQQSVQADGANCPVCGGALWDWYCSNCHREFTPRR